MSHFPGKSSSNKIINFGKQEVATGRQNTRAACLKNKLEFTQFFSLWLCAQQPGGVLKKTKCPAVRKSFSRISEQSLFLIAFSFFKTLPGCRAYSHSIYFPSPEDNILLSCFETDVHVQPSTYKNFCLIIMVGTFKKGHL